MGRASSLMLSGRCECRAVRYRVADEFLYAANCHCSNCRAGPGLRSSRLPASSRTSSGVVEEPTDCSSGATIRPITRGAASAAPSYTRCARRAVRRTWGSALEDNPSISPTEHIFVGSKAPWFNITDDLPQLEEYSRPRPPPVPGRAATTNCAREKEVCVRDGVLAQPGPHRHRSVQGGYQLRPRACARWEEEGDAAR